MQLIRTYRRAGAIVAVVAAAAAISASAASARVLDGPLHQTVQAAPALPTALPVPRGFNLAEIRRAEAQEAQAHSYTVPATARYSDAGLNGYAAARPSAALPAPKATTPSNSFDWGDAAIGAAITAAILLLVMAGTVAVRRRTQLGQA
jgi:hypothetical protein